jgi:hypothetical protein
LREVQEVLVTTCCSTRLLNCGSAAMSTRYSVAPLIGRHASVGERPVTVSPVDVRSGVAKVAPGSCQLMRRAVDQAP